MICLLSPWEIKQKVAMALILNKRQFWTFVLTSMAFNIALFDKNDTWSRNI